MNKQQIIEKQKTKNENIEIIWLQGENISGYKSIEDVGDNFIVKETGSVNHLFCINQSQHFIIVTDGDILIGGKQNRSPKFSFIVAPGEEVEVPVFCIERNRWSYGFERISDSDRSLRWYIIDVRERLHRIERILLENRHFIREELYRLSREFQMIADELREAYELNQIRRVKRSNEMFGRHEMKMTYMTRMAKVYDNQDTVWRTIDEELSKFNKRNRTSDFSKLFEGFKEENIEVPENATGFIITWHSIPVIYESINNHDVFKQYASKLINTYLLNPFLPRREISLEEFIKEIESFNTENKKPVFQLNKNKFYQTNSYKLLKYPDFGNVHFLYINN